MAQKRDWVDYIDPIAKILGGIILTAATFILNTSNEIKKRGNELKQQEISNSLKFGEFTKSLMSDILNTDSARLKSDVALITLNRTIGDSNPKLIAELGARIIENFYSDNGKTVSDYSTMNTLFAIVKERDTAIYSAVTIFAKNYNTKAEVAPLRKAPPSPKDTIGVVDKISDKTWTKLSLIPSKGTVYMQINNPSARYSSLLDSIKSSGFNTPEVEVITYPFKNTIRYYYDSDLIAAEQVKKIAENKRNTPFLLSKKSAPNARKGLIEVWCNY